MPKKFASAGLTPSDVRSVASLRATQRRHERAATCLASATEALVGFSHGDHVFGLTKGQFSMIDLAAAVLAATGPADVAVWTWCIAEYEVEAVSAFIGDGRIRRFRMVMDWSGAQRDMPLVGDLQRRFGADCLRVTKTHAKIVTASNDDWRVVVRGSMNLNANPRFEQFDVSDDAAVFGVVDGIMAELWARSPALPVRDIAHSDAAALFAAAEPPLDSWAPQKRDWWR